MSIHRFVAALVLVGVIAGCASQGAQLASGRPSNAPAATVEVTAPATTVAPADVATPEPTAAPTPEPAPDTPELFRSGEVVTVTSGDEPYLDIVVSNISQKKSYGSGYFIDRPTKGNIYIQAQVSYTALADGATYNPFDWQVFCNDEAVDDYTFVSDGPEPSLSSGTLSKGRKAKGWLVYEVPITGRCVLSYGANSFIGEGAVFEVLLRAK